MKTAVTLEDCRKHGVGMLEIDCQKCGRYGRQRVDKLIAEHGDMALPHLKKVLAADCPSQQSVSLYDRCEALFVNAPRL